MIEQCPTFHCKLAGHALTMHFDSATSGEGYVVQCCKFEKETHLCGRCRDPIALGIKLMVT